uniref:Uncharacterized protein n=1 Tax=Plectus sambesii TaxID=2011161 RepID=A0A914V7R2_9BILA
MNTALQRKIQTLTSRSRSKQTSSALGRDDTTAMSSSPSRNDVLHISWAEREGGDIPTADWRGEDAKSLNFKKTPRVCVAGVITSSQSALRRPTR